MDKLYFTWPGLGDNLILLGAAYNYYKITGEKLNINVDFGEIEEGVEYCNFFRGFGLRSFYSDGVKRKTKECLSFGLEPVFISTTDFRALAPSYEKYVTIWGKKHLITRCCERIGISGNVEIDIPLMRGEKQSQIENSNKVVCVMCGGKQRYKAISPEIMQKVVDYLQEGYTVCQLGARHDHLLKGAKDYRGRSLKEAISILRSSQLLVTGVGGLLHLSRAAGCRCLVLQTTGEPEVLTHYNGNESVYPVDRCELCARNLRDPQHQPCFFNYKCVNMIKPSQVIDKLKVMLAIDSAGKWPQLEYAEADPADGVEDLNKGLSLLNCVSAYY